MNQTAKRILVVAHSGSQGGGELCLDTTLRHLDRSRYDARVLFAWEGPMAESARRMGYPVEVWPLAWWMAYEPSWWQRKNCLLGSLPRIWRLARRIRRERIDLVYTNTAVIFEGALAAWLAGVPHVWHVHEILTPQHMRPRMLPLGWIVRLIGRLSERVIFESDSARRIGEEIIAGQKCVTVYNSLRFRRGEREEDRGERVNEGPPTPPTLSPPSPPLSPLCTIAWIGRFSERKNPLMLLRAVPRMKQAEHARFLLVGEGPLEEAIKSTIHRLGLADRCQLIPFQSDVRPILEACDTLVLTSQEESFGLVLVEAGAYEKPVVATRTQGPAEIVVDGQTGFLVNSGDEAALAQRLDQLVADPQLRRTLGKAGAARADELFSAAKNTRKIEAVLEESLEDRRQ
jgi:glycosyltransferase involved in cell wall biosynthesis